MPTRIGILSDVHADVHALEDALNLLQRLGCDRVLCAGDIVDRGFFPEETIEMLRERKVPCIRGNHDRWATSDEHAEVAQLSGAYLSDAARAFLSALPTSWSATVEGVRVAVHHASPGSDMVGIDPTADASELRALLVAANVEVLLVGHTHHAFVAAGGSGLIANPGALLRPEDHSIENAAENGGTFAVLELPALTFTVYCSTCGQEVHVPRYLL